MKCHSFPSLHLSDRSSPFTLHPLTSTSTISHSATCLWAEGGNINHGTWRGWEWRSTRNHLSQIEERDVMGGGKEAGCVLCGWEDEHNAFLNKSRGRRTCQQTLKQFHGASSAISQVLLSVSSSYQGFNIIVSLSGPWEVAAMICPLTYFLPLDYLFILPWGCVTQDNTAKQLLGTNRFWPFLLLVYRNKSFCTTLKVVWLAWLLQHRAVTLAVPK